MSIYTHCKGFDLTTDRVVYVGEIRDACSFLSASLGTPILLDHDAHSKQFSFVFADDSVLSEKFFRVMCDETIDFTDDANAIPDGVEFTTDLRAIDGAEVWFEEELEAFEEALLKIGFVRTSRYPKRLAKYTRRN
jgi:hypothetical protein